MRSIFSSLFLLGAALALAQKPSFDVASIKPAAPQTEGRIFMSMGGDPGMINYKHVSLRMLTDRAFGIKDYQLNAPDWMATAFFDVQAKLPPDTPQEQRNLMLQSLLEERFGLKFHKESKEVPIYSLVVGKNGAKMPAATELPPNAVKAGNPPPPQVGPSSGGNVAVRQPDGGSEKPRMGGPGTMMMRIEGMGKMHLTAKAMQMSSFVDMLARQVDRPVFDNTGLTGYYDFDIEFKPEGPMMRGMPMPMPHGDGPGGGGPAPDAVEAPSIFTAVQDQLGLKLEPKKGPVETVVVDHFEKTPIEN